jgi:hypothetical protein
MIATGQPELWYRHQAPAERVSGTPVRPPILILILNEKDGELLSTLVAAGDPLFSFYLQ